MRLYGVVPWVMAFLQREGRITYAVLKHEFDLDDAALDAVRQELIFAQRVAMDEDGRVLVWTGGAQATLQLPSAAREYSSLKPSDAVQAPTDPLPPLVTETGTQAVAPPLSSDVIPTDGPSASTGHSIPDAERRQLTVMFCDLADSTTLSQQLDAEDLREVIRAYQATAAAVIQQYEGTVAQYLGYGLLIYFGCPRAHEDDAQRALHSGLGMVEAITTTLNPRLEQEKGVRLTVRIGVHTGPVVVGEMGGGGRHENLATGETVNIAARLEGLAAPNTVVISSTTARLVEGAFALEDLGHHALKGVADPMQVFRTICSVETDGDEYEAVLDGSTFLVGRDEEVGLLLRRWEQSKEGLGQVVLLSGEAAWSARRWKP